MCSPSNNTRSHFISLIFLNDLSYFILIPTAHNFVNDNIFASFRKTLQDLIASVLSESEVALNCFNENKMIVNPAKVRENRSLKTKF